MSKYYKSYSTYVEKKFHQNTSDSRVYEQDKVTIGGTNSFAAGRIPMYAEQNFKFTVRKDIYGQKKHHFGDWLPNCEDFTEEWTKENVDACGISGKEESYEVNRISKDLRDFAYYGSAVELIRASIEYIIRFYPGEIYFGDTRREHELPDGTLAYIDGWVAENPLQIDLYAESVREDEVENLLRVFCGSYEDYSVIINGIEHPVTSFATSQPEGVDINCLVDGQKIKDITIGYDGGTIQLAMYYSFGNRVLIYEDATKQGYRIRPNSTVVEEFFSEALDGFQKLLLSRDTSPMYTITLTTPVETSRGLAWYDRDYTFPTVHDWNLSIDGYAYTMYFQSLLSMAAIFDEQFTDNLYRSMTHEAIKNFDWTYTREYQEGDEDEYVSGGTKIMNLIRLYGRMFDEIKRYADGIRFTNRVTYDGENNIQNSLLKSKLENDGWIITTTVMSGHDKDKIAPVFPGNDKEYTFDEAHTAFLRNLFLNSRYIASAKGTRRGIEMVMALFGVNRDWYDLKEYVYTVAPMTSNIDTVIDLNRNKNIERTDYSYDYDGILVRELYDLDKDNNKINRRLYPWYQNGAKYDGGVIFQSKGGWGKYTHNGTVRYRETSSYINVVTTLEDLVNLPIKTLTEGDIYYVSDAPGYPSNFFKLMSKRNCRSISDTGWKNVTSSEPEVAYLQSIVDENAGNNPHVGYGNYDGGEEYLEYLRTIFKYAIEKNKFTASDLQTARSIGGFTLNGPIEDNKKCWSLFTTDDANETHFKTVRQCDGKYRETSYTMPSSSHDTVNVKRFVISNKSGNSLFAEYFVNYILPYVEQVIPSTVLYELEGFDAGFTGNADSISLNRNTIFFNNNVTADTVTLTATDNWSQVTNSNTSDISPSSGSRTDGTPLSVKKKSNGSYGLEKITFALDKNRNIYTVLNIRNSMISISPGTWEVGSEGGTYTFSVVVDGEPATNDSYRVVCSHPNVTVTKNGDKIYVTCGPNTTREEIEGSITVIHAYDNTCTDSADIIQQASEISITATPSSYEFPMEGGTYTFTVNAEGGNADYAFTVPRESWISSVSKNGNKFTVVVDGNYTGENREPIDIVFTHVDDSNVTATVTISTADVEALAISCNPTSISLDYKAQNSSTTVTAVGGSGLYRLVRTGIPSWLSVTTSGSTVNLKVAINDGNESRETTLTFQHVDDTGLTCTCDIIQSADDELAIEVTPKNYEYPQNGSFYEFTVRVYGGSKTFTYVPSGNEWYTVLKGNGPTTGEYAEYILKVTASRNDGDARNGTISVYHADNAAITDSITVTQLAVEAKEISVTDSTGMAVDSLSDIECEGYSGGTKYQLTVEALPAGSSYIVTNVSSWIKYSQNGNTVILSFNANGGTSDREGSITFQHAQDMSKIKTIKVKQLACEPITLLINGEKTVSWEVPTDGGDETFNITITGGERKYILPELDTWLESSVSPGLTDVLSLPISAEEQPITNSTNRTSTITLVHGDDSSVTASIVINQKEGLSITKSPNEDMLNIGSAGTTKSYNIIAKGGDAQWEVLSNSCGDWVSPVKNGNQYIVNVKQNTSSEDRECEIVFNHINDKSLTTSIKIRQVAFNASVEIVMDEPKEIEVCSFQPSYDCDSINLNPCSECQSLCYKEDIPTNQVYRSLDYSYDVIVMGGSGKWVTKGYADASCCDSDDVECASEDNLIDVDWITAYNNGGSLQFTVDENRELCSKTDVAEGVGCTLGQGKERSACIILAHADDANIMDKLKVHQEGAKVNFANFKISTEPEAVRIPARGEDIVEGEGMTAEYYMTDTLFITSTKDKFINCLYEKTLYVPWNATTDCVDVPPPVPCVLRLNGEEVVGMRTKIRYDSFPYNGGAGNVPITCNEQWNAEVTSGDWISLDTTSGTNGNLTFIVSPNDTCSGRTGAILVTACPSDLSGESKQISIDVYQEKGHQCTLFVWPIHPVPSVIPPEGGIYKYRVASFDCTDPIPWTATANGCSVHCVAGYDGGTESVGVTVKVPKGSGGSVSVTFQQTAGASPCELQTMTIEGTQSDSGATDGGSGDCSDGNYVMFNSNSNPLNIDSSGKTWVEAISRYCTGVTSFSVEIEGEDQTNNITLNPTSGEIDIVNVSVGENTGNEARTIKITIHPNDTEKVPNAEGNSLVSLLNEVTPEEVTYSFNGEEFDNPPLPTKPIEEKAEIEKQLYTFYPSKKVTEANSAIEVDGEVYSDYTDDIQEAPKSSPIIHALEYNVVPYTVSPYKRAQYDPDQTEIEDTDEYGDATNSIEPELVNLVFGENMEPEERQCSIFFEQKEADENGEKQVAEYKIFQEAATIELRDYRFTACPISFTIGPDGGTLVADIESKANKYINGIKREENIPVGYTCFCKPEEIIDDNTASGNTGNTGNTGGEGSECEQCAPVLHAVENHRNLGSAATAFTLTIAYSCYQGSPLPWTIRLVDRETKAAPTWARVTPTSGPGYCCQHWDPCQTDNPTGKDQCVAESPLNLQFTIDANTGSTERVCDWYFETAGACTGSSTNWILQRGSGQPENYSYWYMFEDASDINVGTNGGSGTLGLVFHTDNPSGCTIANCDVERVVSDGDWVEASVSNTAMNWNAAAIAAGEPERRCTVTVYPNDQEKAVCQPGANGISTYALPPQIMPMSVDVDWLSIDCSTNVITVQPNDDYVNDRFGTISFKQNDSDLMQHIHIFQKRKDRTYSYNLLTEPTYYRFDLTGGTLNLEVQSHMIENLNNVEQNKYSLGYTVVGTAPWCTIDPKTNFITCEPNEDGLESRSMTFIFTQDKSGINHTVLIEQQEQFRYDFIVSPNSLTFEAGGGTQGVSVTSQLVPILDGEELEPRKLEYEVTGGGGWCSVSADGTSISCSANTDKENARVTVVTYTQEKTGLINHVVVFQKKPDILPELYEYIDTQDAMLQAQINAINSCTC